MRWLIDGYNVIRADPDLAGIDRRNLEEGRSALLAVVARVARGSRDDFTVVFDGARLRGAAGAAGRVGVVFSRPPEKADDVLVRLARESGPGATVVTSDRGIQAAARRARAGVVGAAAFLDRAADRPLDRDARDKETLDDDAEPEAPGKPKKGNPRRLSRAERQTRRALGRLRSPGR